MDISLDVAYVSKTVLHSHHSPTELRTPFPSHYTKKPDVKEFTETGVIFKDGTFEEIDDAIFCTGCHIYDKIVCCFMLNSTFSESYLLRSYFYISGFDYDYPFLDETSGLTITPKSLTPLYKYLVNINQPTMMMVGLIVKACIVVAIDAQVR